MTAYFVNRGSCLPWRALGAFTRSVGEIQDIWLQFISEASLKHLKGIMAVLDIMSNTYFEDYTKRPLRLTRFHQEFFMKNNIYGMVRQLNTLLYAHYFEKLLVKALLFNVLCGIKPAAELTVDILNLWLQMISYYLKEIYRDQPISNDVVCSIHKVLIR
jgi:hypothetical protein